MSKFVSLFSCASRQKTSSDNSRVYEPVVQVEENIRNHRTIKRSGILTRTFRRISNGFRHKSSTHALLNRPVIENQDRTDENPYEPIPLNDFAYTTDSFCRYLANITRRSPPEITWKHLWSTIETENALIDSTFSRIPTELYLQIFLFLSITDLGNVSLVCRKFKMVADSDEIWKLKCQTSNRLFAKSFKEIYMDWVYEKYLRNEELRRLERQYSNSYLPIAAMEDIIKNTSPFFFLEPVTQVFVLPVAGFLHHPNASQEMTIQLSVDLDRTMRELISLFEKVSAFQEYWYKPDVLKQMIQRYYRFMKLKADFQFNIILVPTLDIEMIWQIHLSHSQMYRADCLRLFGQIIHHSLLTDNIGQFLKEQAFIETCQLYEEHFSEEYCPLPIDIGNRNRTSKYEEALSSEGFRCIVPSYSYWDETSFDFTKAISTDYENLFSFTEDDVIAGSYWLDSYKTFMYDTRWKMSNGAVSYLLERNHDTLNIKLMKKSYERFLYVNAKYPTNDGQMSVYPTYAIDLVWRCHKQQPSNYANDCLKFVGFIIDGDVQPSHATNENQIKPDEKTNKIWKNEFNNDITSDHLRTFSNQNYSLLLDPLF